MKDFGGPINKPTDNWAYKDDNEKAEIHEELRVNKMQLEIRLGLLVLGGIALFTLGKFIYSYLTGK